MIQKVTNKISNKRALVGIAASALVLVFLAVMMEGKMQAAYQHKQLAAALTAIQQEAKVGHNKKIDVHVQAQAAIVYDINTSKVLYSKNADRQMPLASITKLVTALVAQSELGATSPLTVTPEALATEGESGLIAGDVWRERDLSDFMLAVSSNDAATVFAHSGNSREGFIVKMNQFVQSLGLRSIVLFNESGLDKDAYVAGGYGSARDIAHLMTYAIVATPKLLEATTIAHFNSVSATGLRYKAVNTNKLVGKIPGLMGGKTGFTDIAGGNLTVVFDAGIGRPVVVVVLGSTKDGRFADVLKLVNAVI